MRARAAEAEGAGRLPLGRVLVYAAPSAGLGFMFFFVNMYLMKYATDVLGVSAAAMGTIFAVSRVWDGVTDPLVGYWSDRTHTRLGRRRPWLFAGAFPVGLAFVLLLAPPAALGPTGLVLWTGVAFTLFFSATTVFSMPHTSLGAELSTRYEERNRIFGFERMLSGLGAVAVFGTVTWLAGLDPPAQREWGLVIGLTAAAATGLLMLNTALRLREPRTHLGRGPARPFRAFADVLANPHARRLFAAYVLTRVGLFGVSGAAAYFADYVLGDPRLLGVMLGAVFAFSVVSVPVWVALGQRYDKRSLASLAMLGLSLAIGGIFFIRPGDLLPLALLATLAGVASGGLDLLLTSIQADVIDYDELRSGERKEGVYFAVWYLGGKSAAALAGALIGFALAASGFEPNAAQGAPALATIRALVSLIPFVFFAAGALLFLGFRLDRAAHAEIRAELDGRH